MQKNQIYGERAKCATQEIEYYQREQKRINLTKLDEFRKRR